MVVAAALLPFLLFTVFLSSAAGVGGLGIWFGGGSPDDSGEVLSSSYEALQAWKSAITEDPKGVLQTWVGPDVCSYRGVFCSDPPEESTSSGQVVAIIDLNHASLKGTLVEDLSRLTHLSALHLNSNHFWGAIPGSLGNLQYLSELDLSNNMLSGPFPAQVLSIPNLNYLDLRFNGFVGAVPGELFEKDMDAVFLHNNMFDGQIPAGIWDSPASVVTFANNRFSGDLPATFNRYGESGLREVLFHNNDLSGCIPEGIGYANNLEVLDFSNNSFVGRLPSSISCLSDIEVLNIAHNQISGVLSDVVCSVRSLVNLTISFNFFSGLSDHCNKPPLRFDYSRNCIPGREMQRPPPECESVSGNGQRGCFGMPSTGSVPCRNPVGSAGATVGLSVPLPQVKIPLPKIGIHIP